MLPKSETMKLKLDAKTIPALVLPKGRADEICWDAELEGFGIRLRRRNDGGLLRNWVTQYRAGGHTRRITIGSADKIMPTQARDAARKILARVELGADPQAEKAAKRQREARTVRAVVAEYLAAREPELRPASHRVARIYLTGSYFRALHPLAVTTVTRADVATAVRNIARERSVPTAAAARRALSAFFAWCIQAGILGNGANPVAGSHRPADPTPRDHVLSLTELVAVWNACGDDGAGRIIRLMILLASRRQEIGGMRWSELLDGVWVLPGVRSKNRRSCTIALPPTALEIIQSVPRTSRDFLFGNSGAGFVGWSHAKALLDRRLGDRVRRFNLHDLRRSAATHLGNLGVAPHVIENLLNHHRQNVATTYNRSRYDREVTAALQLWDEHLRALIEGRDSNVVAMQRA
jgi:integrase